MKIKELLGFCGVKGCNHRAYCTATLTAKRKQDGIRERAGTHETVMQVLKARIKKIKEAAV